MYLRMVGASLVRDPRRKVVAFTAVTLGVLATTALVSVLVASGDRLTAELGAYGANLEVVPAEGHDTFDAAELAEIRRIFWRHNILAIAPELPLRVRLRRLAEAGARRAGSAQAGPREPVIAPLIGTWFDVVVEESPTEGAWRSGLPATRPTLGIDGRWPRDGESKIGSADGSPAEAGAPNIPQRGDVPEIALGRRLADRLGVEPGDRVEVSLGFRHRELEVVGRVTSGGAEEEQAFAPLPVVAALADRPGPEATRAEVFALTVPEPNPAPDPETLDGEAYETWYCTAYPSAIAHQIDEALPDARARVLTGITDATARLLSSLRRLLLALTGVILVGSGLGVAAVTTTSMLERRREAGLLVALGAETWKVAGLFVAEALVIGLAGGLTGGLLGLAAGRFLGKLVLGVTVPWVPVLLPLAVAAGCAVAVAGALGPVARLLRDRPALALKEVTA
jgi:putative ABC transport system permease protein